MRIDRAAPSIRSIAGRPAPAAASYEPLADPGSPAATPALPACLAVAGPFVGQAERGPLAEMDRAARQHGGAILDALGGLQLAFLHAGPGAGGRAALADLAALTGRVLLADDPALAQVMQEIRTRAAVELAKTEAAPR